MTKVKIVLIGVIVLAVVIAGILFIAHNPKSRTLPEPTRFIFGTKFIVEEKIINNVGGEILIKKPNTPIDGIRVVFPAGSVPDNTKIETGYYEGEWKLSGSGRKNNFMLPLILNLDKKLNEGSQPIEIYKKADMAYQVNDVTGRLEPMIVVNGVTYAFRPKNIITFTDWDL